ncbi:hypothetical protein J4228_04885 [Candidatus Woesearchaeota archaeon]|nr:hypothetical protein [Candidatus Woesearchaeota archaeon]
MVYYSSNSGYNNSTSSTAYSSSSGASFYSLPARKPTCCGRKSGGSHLQCPSCPFR